MMESDFLELETLTCMELYPDLFDVLDLQEGELPAPFQGLLVCRVSDVTHFDRLCRECQAFQNRRSECCSINAGASSFVGGGRGRGGQGRTACGAGSSKEKQERRSEGFS